ncbi:hypothetical protein Btru_063346 [Bulinus truncatus]|nr:hypothetical protein Btru_063346 [Bulinus truncatus]
MAVESVGRLMKTSVTVLETLSPVRQSSMQGSGHCSKNEGIKETPKRGLMSFPEPFQMTAPEHAKMPARSQPTMSRPSSTTMAMHTTHHALYLDTPWPSQRPPYSPTLINLNQNYNMTANSLTEALLILSSMYLSLVQPESEPANVSLYTIFTDTFTASAVKDRQEFILDKPQQPGSSSRSKVALNATTVKHLYPPNATPRYILNMLCKDFFVKNSVTVLLINNHYSKTKFSSPDAMYLRKTFESLGVPIISYDTKLSEKSKRSLTLELAPTISQMMDAFFAFLKKFSWTDFSFLCALSTGCDSVVESIRQKVDDSNKLYNISVYGVEIFAYRLLSYVNITNVTNEEEITDKLMYELDRDTRIVLVHGDTRNVLTIMEKAKDVGLTREDYVWIFTLTAMEQAALGDTVNQIYPIGSFVIGFDSSVPDLATDAYKLWFGALKSMAAANEIENIDFQTHFSCDIQKNTFGDGVTTLFWKYGDTLYKYLLKGKFSDHIEFDDKGFLKFNTFWIKNVQAMAGSEISNKKDSSQSLPKFFDTKARTSSRQYPLSAQKRDPWLTGLRDSVRHSFADRDSPQGQDASDNETPNVDSRAGHADNGGRMDDYKNSSRKFPFKYGNVKMKHLDVQQRQYGKHRLAKRNARPFGRRVNLNSLQKVATWNGHNLTVTGIVWPGGSSSPPKGKPEKYILKVVTWAEDPHVIYTPVKNQSGLDGSKCESNAMPCKVYIRDNLLHRKGNQTRDVCCAGLTIDLLQRLSQMLSFDVEIAEVADGSYGSPVNVSFGSAVNVSFGSPDNVSFGSPVNNNESDWTGMVGMLIHKKADMAIGAISITPERSVVVDFSMPFLQTGITIIVAVREGAISPTAFLEVRRSMFDELQVRRSMFDELQVRRSMFDKLQVRRSMFDELQVRRSIFDELQVRRSMFDELQARRSMFDELQVKRSMFDELQARRYMFDELQVRRSMFDEIQVRRSMFDELQIRRSMFDELQVRRSMFDELQARRSMFDE